MKVYDLVNAGPNHRFLVRNKAGQPLLVSNCTQGIAADIMFGGSVNAEKTGFILWALIHDQALARAAGKLEDFVAALTKLPEWATGLPLKADGERAKYYTKAP